MTDDVFVYDDDCGFCKWWANYIADRTELDMVGFSELTDAQLERLPDDYEKCAHLVTDETVYSCGAAVEQALARADVPPGSQDIFGFFRQFEDYERFRERVYGEVADRRGVLGHFLSREEVTES
ncbi:MAG: putative DCC family thiol-disulfide oxidoreductase YuxK [Natronomonas sp.]|jgi:predicted DCC family thiol-disulfide oxidoreductase YuxK|uniref:DCC1-like thiol-disulfide oxidoreductase family protein n=1 Tax=Natronomonas sp. TaxID=2184060 RepID=UPI003989C1EE